MTPARRAGSNGLGDKMRLLKWRVRWRTRRVLAYGERIAAPARLSMHRSDRRHLEQRALGLLDHRFDAEIIGDAPPELPAVYGVEFFQHQLQRFRQRDLVAGRDD